VSLTSIAPVDPVMPDEEVDLFSKEGSYSLFRLLNSCPAAQRAVEELPPELLEKTENELLRRPDDVQRRVKISFWNEFRRCQRVKQSHMVLSNIQFGVCSMSYWQKQVVGRPEILAWVITPPTAEILVWQELLELGHKKLRKVLKLPLVEKRYWKDKTGELHCEKRTNVSLVKEIRAIVEGLQNRLHGAVVQRQEIQSKNVNISLTDQGSRSISSEMDEIKAMLGRIETVANTMPELEEGAIIDGTIIPEDKET